MTCAELSFSDNGNMFNLHCVVQNVKSKITPENKKSFLKFCIFPALEAYREGRRNNTRWLVTRYWHFRQGYYSLNAYTEILTGFILGREEIQW